MGVLNLSNKRDGAPFDELDLDRAVLAGSVLAMTLSHQQGAHAAVPPPAQHPSRIAA